MSTSVRADRLRAVTVDWGVEFLYDGPWPIGASRRADPLVTVELADGRTFTGFTTKTGLRDLWQALAARSAR